MLAQRTQLVALLNQLFSRFDYVTEEHRVYKVETIGDVYLVSAGVPEPRSGLSPGLLLACVVSRPTLLPGPRPHLACVLVLLPRPDHAGILAIVSLAMMKAMVGPQRHLIQWLTALGDSNLVSVSVVNTHRRSFRWRVSRAWSCASASTRAASSLEYVLFFCRPAYCWLAS